MNSEICLFKVIHINRFEDFLVWQKAQKLTLSIYKMFKNCNDFSFRDQIQKASVSIMNNIAEGFERKPNKEFKYFSFISKDSSGEVRSMLYLAKELNYVSEKEFIDSFKITEDISKMIAGLIKKL